MKALSSKYQNKKKVVEMQGEQFVVDFMRCSTYASPQHLERYIFPVQMSDVWDIAQKVKLHYVISPNPPYRDKMIFF